MQRTGLVMSNMSNTINSYTSHPEVDKLHEMRTALIEFMETAREIYVRRFNSMFDCGWDEVEIVNILSKRKSASIFSDMLNKLVADTIPSHPKDEYPLARKLKRHFVIHSGTTELYYELLELYYTFCKTMGIACDYNVVAMKRIEISDEINEYLLTNIKDVKRKCRYCGKTLEWNFPFSICQKCYHSQQYYDYWDNDSW